MEELTEKLLALKIEEALTILRTLDQSVDAFLVDFSEPGKIDLAEFMEQNYMFNMLLYRFSYLTGRSLTTFKGDYNNIYGVTPQRWLTKRRLKLAYYMLSEGKQNQLKCGLRICRISHMPSRNSSVMFPGIEKIYDCENGRNQCELSRIQ